MKRQVTVLKSLIYLLCGASLTTIPTTAQEPYFPAAGAPWTSRDPATLNIDPERLAAATRFAQDHEYTGEVDLRIAILRGFAREPFHELKGPTKKRGGPAGMILKDGYLVAHWGDTKRVDMTFSVTKSYLATVAGLAFDAGLIGDVQNPLHRYVWDGTFEGAHNRKITWHQLLNQSSDWSGSLFGLHDWSDRPPREGGLDEWKKRPLHPPGTRFEYNDVRVNVLAYALLQVWRKPLPQILKERIMDPIGASTTWRWYGYSSSWVNVDGLKVQSVSGGGHSGGGLFVNTEDHARFGLLFLHNGRWQDRQLISREWIERSRRSSEAMASYGYMWWLNRGRRKWSGVDDETIFYAAGFGGNFIVVDQTNQLVTVTRWLEPNKIGELIKQVRGALE